MAQATFSIRMDEELKKKFDKLCTEFGMNATTAFNIFARAVVRERKIPFEIKANEEEELLQEGRIVLNALREEAKKKGIQDMSLEEINEEINLARREKEVGCPREHSSENIRGSRHKCNRCRFVK